MATVTLKDIRKSFGAVEVIKGIDLEIKHGEFCVFVGPSGCGKSTLLRMISGLEEQTSGTIEIGGRDVSNAEPSERGIAMVFQSYALYPHLTVRQNIGFGLSLARLPKDQINERVNEAARILQLESYLDRKPKALSGGQRQRVAIGRAITRNPEVFLFDEPLSNLDAALRSQMRVELTDLHKSLGSTMIYVTHDQVEAMTMADKIVVLNYQRKEVTMKMVLKTLSVGELRSPNSTARQHNRQQRKKARALFSEHGIVVPIIVDERMQIIDGILRFEIAKELGLQELNAVVVSDATEAKLLQLELSLNRLAEDGAWDTERLKSKFEQLIEYNVDLTFTGFETAEIDNTLHLR